MAIVITSNNSPNEDPMDQERIAKLEIQVESIKENVKEMKDDIKEIHSRITTGNREIVEKMDDMQTRIEHKMNAQSEVSAAQHKSMQEDLQKVAKTLDEDINKVSNRVDILEKWRWMIVGGAIVFGYILGHIEYFKDILKL